jgi:hypothetical protein
LVWGHSYFTGIPLIDIWIFKTVPLGIRI